MALNIVTLQGRLAKGPELRRTQSGKAVTSFSIACSRDFGSKETDWIDCVSWDKTAEFVNSYFRKGSAIILEGRLQTRTYEDKSGSKRKAVEVVTERVYFGESKAGAAQTAQGAPAPQQEQKPQFEPANEDDGDLPF